MFRFIGKIFKWGLVAVLLTVLALLAPIGYVETFCRADPNQRAYKSIVTDKEFTRGEANSYLTYPEWHIVYAYEGLANVLKTRDEYAFDYTTSISGFWRAYCGLNKKANQHGGGEFGTRLVIYTIGASFTLEMMLKAAYEETLGRVFALIRGSQKTQQDQYAAEMAQDYATFLQQIPWFKYDFNAANDTLWNLPVENTLRGWERRLALGLEWKAKSGYASIIDSSAGLAGAPQLRFRSVVKNLTPDQLSSINEVDIVSTTADYTIIETPRYRKLTRIIIKITEAGGELVEIAGNDDIMLSAVEPANRNVSPFQTGRVLSVINRDGFNSRRILVALKVSELGKAIKEISESGREIEHIYDY
ncbi:MAG: hypothetical protein AAGF54_07625 [Pseudomonadota bacterium]